MDPSLLIGNSTSGSSGVQGMQSGHHHHHKSISDQVSQMGSAIDNAVQAGTMTNDQATALKKELADITQTLSQNAQTSSNASTTSTGTSDQTGSISQLSDADRKKIFSELQDVRKQLWATQNPQGASATTGSTGASNAVSSLFSAIDTNGDGSIDQNELTQFLAQIGANALGYNTQGSAASSATGGSTFSIFG